MQTPDKDRAEDRLAMRLGISHQAHISRHGETLGEPAARERLSEVLGRPPTRSELHRWKVMRRTLGRDATAEELAEYMRRLRDQASERRTKG